jgi:hypothetical protein
MIILGSSSQCSIFLLISSSFIKGIILGLASQCSNLYLSSSSTSSSSYLGCHHNPPIPSYLFLLHLLSSSLSSYVSCHHKDWNPICLILHNRCWYCHRHRNLSVITIPRSYSVSAIISMGWV